VSVAEDEFMTNPTPAVGTELRAPVVPPAVARDRKITVFAVTDVFTTVMVPAVMAAVVPMRALAPSLI